MRGCRFGDNGVYAHSANKRTAGATRTVAEVADGRAMVTAEKWHVIRSVHEGRPHQNWLRVERLREQRGGNGVARGVVSLVVAPSGRGQGTDLVNRQRRQQQVG